MKRILLLPFLTFSIISLAQTTFQKQKIVSEKVQIIDPGNAKDDYRAQLINMEAPTPNGDSYRSFLMRQKIESAKKFPRIQSQFSPQKTTAESPKVGDQTRMFRYIGPNRRDVTGGIPNDNTLAISDSGIVLASINSLVWAYDTHTDTTLFYNDIMSLRQIGGGSNSNNDFDPKLMYDAKYDRFVLVYLQNNTPDDSRIKVCFSSTNNPADPWYSYVLPGNPLNNNRWTDFPTMSMTEDELFITVNLIIPNVSWQVGFDGSVIWQIDKHQGFAGNSVLENTLWSDIKHNGKYTRNVHAVWGAEGDAEEAYFLSNRNFDVTNDTIFLIHLTGNQNDPNTTLEVTALQTTPNYGVPPNGRQADTDLSDPTKGLQTNDARVLGAIAHSNWIQFVSNTINPNTGFAAIYHGTISNPLSNPTVKGNIISHPTRDFGYPNIAWTGDEDCDIESIIGFNFTSPTEFPGVATIYYGNDSSYSDLIDLKAGENYTDRHSDSYERWGDYFGMQRKFNNPKTVWLAGYFGNDDNYNATYVAEVISPDSNHFEVELAQTGNALFCTGAIKASATGGETPYQFSFDGGSTFSAQNEYSGICEGDTIEFIAKDARGCSFSETFVFEKTIAPSQPVAFPNPFDDQMVVQFKLEKAQTITAYIADQTGKLVATIIDQPAKTGQNQLIFSTAPLASGTYFLHIEGSAGFKMKEKIIKIRK